MRDESTVLSSPTGFKGFYFHLELFVNENRDKIIDCCYGDNDICVRPRLARGRVVYVGLGAKRVYGPATCR